MNLKVTLSDKLTLRNPVMTASGTFGYGPEYADFIDLNRLGGIVVKGTTLNPRQGNPYPRMAETPSGMLNAVGLQNPGVDAFVRDIYPTVKDIDTAIVVNVSGASPEDYAEVCRRLRPLDKVAAVEVNISCPNVKQGGMAFGTTCSGAERMKPVLSTVTGGLSGPCIRPIAVRMVWQVAKAVSIPVVGLGGIMNGHDALEFLMAGATAVQLGTANFIDPCASVKTLEEIEDFCSRHGVKDIHEIIGIL